MISLSVTDARRDIFNLVKTVQNSNAVTITSKDGNAVLVSEEEWNGIKETLYLLSIPGMLESILKSSAEDVSEMERWEEIKDTL
jgi:prevent-host-death family protein